MWLAFLSDGSISGDIVQNRADGFGDVSRSIAILLTIFGAIGGYLLSSTFVMEHRGSRCNGNSVSFASILYRQHWQVSLVNIASYNFFVQSCHPQF